MMFETSVDSPEAQEEMMRKWRIRRAQRRYLADLQSTAEEIRELTAMVRACTERDDWWD